MPSGVSLALTAFSNGAIDPDLSTALAALGDTQYHPPYLTARDAVSALDTVLQERWEPTMAKEGVAFIPAVGTLSQMTALNTAAPALPVVAASPANANPNAVTLTCRWGGTTGNQIDLRHSYRQEDALPSGISLALTAFSGGATDPDLSTALAALGDTQYHTLALPYSDSAAVSALSTVLKKRWKPTVAKEGVAFILAVGTLSDMTTLGRAAICSAWWGWARGSPAAPARLGGGLLQQQRSRSARRMPPAPCRPCFCQGTSSPKPLLMPSATPPSQTAFAPPPAQQGGCGLCAWCPPMPPTPRVKQPITI